MAKLKSAEILRKRKDAKQKKLLLVLVPVFVLLLVWQGPSYLRMLTGSDDTAATPAETSPSTETTPAGATPDPSVAPPPSTTVPGATQEALPVDGSTSLPDSDQPPPADSGQLVSFERFVGKDPFEQLVDTSPTVSEPTVSPVPAPSNPGSTGGTPSPDPNDDGGSDDDDGEPVAAVIKVNGEKETVSLDGEFPKDEELFVLEEAHAHERVDRARLGRVLERQGRHQGRGGRHAQPRQPAGRHPLHDQGSPGHAPVAPRIGSCEVTRDPTCARHQIVPPGAWHQNVRNAHRNVTRSAGERREPRQAAGFRRVPSVPGTEWNKTRTAMSHRRDGQAARL